jgi:ABC-type glycerol-3-phosphate transport system substrate-binding protein
MKSLKLILALMFIALMTASMASTDGGFKSKPKKVVSITYANAIRNPELVATMYQQLDPSFLDTHEHLYVVEVTHNGVLYRILGSRQSWIKFFRLNWKFPGDNGANMKSVE